MTYIGYHSDFLAHDPGPNHPESPWRLQSILNTLQEHPLPNCTWIENLSLATISDLQLAHSTEYINSILSLNKKTGQLDHETIISPGTVNAALRAAGGGLALVDTVLNHSADNVFLLCRPPGHHAGKNFGLGFCLFNNLAIAAKHLVERRGLQRVAIIDFDIHHGNGTENIVQGDHRLLFISTHQHNLFPVNSGHHSFQNIINLPLPDHTTDEVLLTVFDTSILPQVIEFQPEFILVSCGFDGHHDDPLGGWDLSVNAYFELIKRLQSIQNQLVIFLEGGYATHQLGNCAKAVLSALSENERVTP